MTWKAWLEGHEFDFADLTRLFGSGEIVVTKDDEGYYLTSTEIERGIDRQRLYDKAEHLLSLVNGTAKADNPAFRPVKLNGSFQNGDQRHVFAFAEVAFGRIQAFAAAVVTDPDGNELPPPPPPGPDRVRNASKHSDAAEALKIMGRPEPTSWVDLYKVHEIVRDAMGGQAALIKTSWVTKDDLSAFTGSANRSDVAGADARHARMKGDPPKRTMQIAEARDFIGRLLNSWLDSLQ